MNYLVKLLLEKFKGFDFWAIVFFLIIGFIGWHYYGNTTELQTERIEKQIIFISLVIIICLIIISLYHYIIKLKLKFQKGELGILILKIAGDDNDNSLQRDLLCTLNSEFNKEILQDNNIEIRAYKATILEESGLARGHIKARKIGNKFNAQLVIWGNKIGEDKYHPRITLVNNKPRPMMVLERTLTSMNLTDLSIPQELIQQPFFLLHFTAGYYAYIEGEFIKAIEQFFKARNQSVASQSDLTIIDFYLGTSHCFLAQNSKEKWNHLMQASKHLNNTILNCKNQTSELWAKTMNNIGNVLSQITTTKQNENIIKAIYAYNLALQVFTKKNFPDKWATTISNLGAAYLSLKADKKNENLVKAINYFKSALLIKSKDFSIGRAFVQNNLGSAYAILSEAKYNEYFKKAIHAYKSALRISYKNKLLALWANININLGNIFLSLNDGDRNKNIKKAINSYEASLSVFSKEKFPIEWGSTQNYLGIAWSKFKENEHDDNLKKAVSAFESALSVFTKEEYPLDWVIILNNLGNTCLSIQGNDAFRYKNKAKTAFNSMLSVFKKSTHPFKWAITQTNLGFTYASMISNSNDTNMKRSIESFQRALEVINFKNHPYEYKIIKKWIDDITKYSNMLATNTYRVERQTLASNAGLTKLSSNSSQP